MGGKGSEGGGEDLRAFFQSASGGGGGGGRQQTQAEANRIRQSRGHATGGGSQQAPGRPQQAATGEGSQRPQGGGGGINTGSAAAKALGTLFGSMVGGAALGGPGMMYGGYKGYQSGKEGWIGDAMNARSGETFRDYLEGQGVSRKDTALAQRHGALERGARDQGYTGSANVSLLDEGEDYDSVTGEIF